MGGLSPSPDIELKTKHEANDARVTIRTASGPEGPWYADVPVYTATPNGGGYWLRVGMRRHGPAVHSYLYTTGKTVLHERQFYVSM